MSAGMVRFADVGQDNAESQSLRPASHCLVRHAEESLPAVMPPTCLAAVEAGVASCHQQDAFVMQPAMLDAATHTAAALADTAKDSEDTG